MTAGDATPDPFAAALEALEAAREARNVARSAYWDARNAFALARKEDHDAGAAFFRAHTAYSELLRAAERPE